MAQNYSFPAGFATATNPSVGTNSTAIPTSSTEVGGKDPGGLLKPISVSTGGVVDVTVNGTVPLPTGAATAAKQDTGNTSLASIDTKTPALGQGLMAASVPVAIASNQSAIPVSAASLPLPSGAATEATLSTLNGKITACNTGAVVVSSSALPSGASTAAKQPALGTAGTASADVITIQGIASMTAVKVDGSGSTQPVSGTVAATQSGTWNVTNVSGTVSLPTGASTSALQTTGNTSLSSIDTKTPALGQALAAASVPVVLTAAQISTLTPLATVAATQSGAWNVTNVSGTVSLPTGAATSANQTSGGQKTQIATPTAGTVTQAAITVGTSAVRLTVSGSAPSASRSVLVATPDSASTATFYIGSSSVANSGANRGLQIVAGQTFTANSDAGDYYIISSTASQTVYVVEQA